LQTLHDDSGKDDVIVLSRAVNLNQLETLNKSGSCGTGHRL